jgi:hypothetical protein
MNKYYLFLDDIRMPTDVSWVELPNVEWTIIRNYSEFRNIILNLGIPEFVTYDHDLSDCHYGHGLNNDAIPYDSYIEKTGYDCAKWLVDYCISKNLPHPPCVVHSMNPIGKLNIVSYINSYNRSIKV